MAEMSPAAKRLKKEVGDAMDNFVSNFKAEQDESKTFLLVTLTWLLYHDASSLITTQWLLPSFCPPDCPKKFKEFVDKLYSQKPNNDNENPNDETVYWDDITSHFSKFIFPSPKMEIWNGVEVYPPMSYCHEDNKSSFDQSVEFILETVCGGRMLKQRSNITKINVRCVSVMCCCQF